MSLSALVGRDVEDFPRERERESYGFDRDGQRKVDVWPIGRCCLWCGRRRSCGVHPAELGDCSRLDQLLEPEKVAIQAFICWRLHTPTSRHPHPPTHRLASAASASARGAEPGQDHKITCGGAAARWREACVRDLAGCRTMHAWTMQHTSAVKRFHSHSSRSATQAARTSKAQLSGRRARQQHVTDAAEDHRRTRE